MLVTAKDCLKNAFGVEACESFCPFLFIEKLHPI